MKILCVIDSLRFGGTQQQLIVLAVGFKEKGHIVSFLTYHHIPFFNAILEKAGILVTCIQEPNYLKRLWKMRHFIRNGNYDSVLSFLEAANFICEVSGFPTRKWKLVIGERSANPYILKSFKLFIYRWFHFYADYIVSNSNSNIQIVQKINPILSKAKCKIIYNAIDFNRWKPISEYTPRKNAKTKLIVAARQSYEKNLNGLIEALNLLSVEDRDKIIIEWYGDTGLEPFNTPTLESRKKIKKYNLENIISFYPATHEITKIIQEADAIGLFSFYEGLPNIVCEAMACAKPVICSHVSDLPELLSSDINLLCDPFSPKSIKQSICYLINLSKDQLLNIGLINKRIAMEKFIKEVIISKYLSLLINNNNSF